MLLHGASHEMTIPVLAEIENDHWKATAKFSVPFIDWGLKNPSNFFLKVDRTVQIDAALTGALQTTPSP